MRLLAKWKRLNLGVALAIGVQALGGAILPARADGGAGPEQPQIPGPQGGNIVPGDVPPDAVAVTDDGAIKALLDDRTIYGRYYDGEDWIEYHLTDGRTAYWEKGCTYPGRWWVQNGQICYAYANYRNGAANCFILFTRPDGSVTFVSIADDGSTYMASFSLKMDSGNSAHLAIGGLSPCVGV